MKLRTIQLIALATLVVGCSTSTYNTPSMASAMTSSSQTALNAAMRKLWADHVTYTRLYIIAAANGTADAQPTLDRLMQNQDEIGQAIAPYYGADAGNKLGQLLRQHIAIAGDIVAAAKANDQAKVNDGEARWHANAADLATFLSGANPNWPRQAVLDMLNTHLSLTTDEAVNRLHGNYAQDIADFDKIFNQAMMMADTLSNGIIKQFPNRFA